MRRSPLPIPQWSNIISFELVIPSLNRYRSYHLELTRDLFGHWVLTRT